MRIARVLSVPEWAELSEFCRAREGYFLNDRRVFLPGTAWYCPWYFDPLDELRLAGGNRRGPMIPAARKGELGFLSVHYWRDWADKRAPLCVVCPNGETWEMDRKSSNGDGWTVTGDPPDITATPSIVVEGYHGFLRAGEFTADLDGRGPNGHARPLPTRPHDHEIPGEPHAPP